LAGAAQGEGFPPPLKAALLFPSCSIFFLLLYSFSRKDDMPQKNQAREAAPKNSTIIPMAKVLLLKKSDEERFCGMGMCQLLEAILKTGTVRGACVQMNMSYSKGWKLVRKLEAWLGAEAVVRHQGGRGGGEANLTQAGLDFLEKYAAFEKECQRAVNAAFKKYYQNEA
jgi:molybdate transport repressor ModE-like protein